jgi:hypothetical protein
MKKAIAKMTVQIFGKPYDFKNPFGIPNFGQILSIS